MFYLISEKNGMIIESFGVLPTLEALQELANDFACAFYVIEGQHAGITVEPQIDEELESQAAEDYQEAMGHWDTPGGF